jgi:hypothetical protein
VCAQQHTPAPAPTSHTHTHTHQPTDTHTHIHTQTNTHTHTQTHIRTHQKRQIHSSSHDAMQKGMMSYVCKELCAFGNTHATPTPTPTHAPTPTPIDTQQQRAITRRMQVRQKTILQDFADQYHDLPSTRDAFPQSLCLPQSRETHDVGHARLRGRHRGIPDVPPLVHCMMPRKPRGETINALPLNATLMAGSKKKHDEVSMHEQNDIECRCLEITID